ncbi:sugar ABC transporter permease [Vibrio sp. HB161653]|uniref:Carbohydrate ABC transporter permease n=2 Tax=unclassified Vibrio TaxID=2614977 RepID=A0AB39HIR8_9VIBR|nr:sugar ABC transporter permease [Vibrio sp. HB161653]MDP5254710.1 sugar ABC transporter permease [Vibrio sp. HB161653]
MDSSMNATYPKKRIKATPNKRTLSSGILPWVFLMPSLLVFGLYVLYPIIQSISLSFYQWDGLGEKIWVGLDNYRELFQSDAFYTSLKNNFIWLVFFMLAPPIGLMIALFLNQQIVGIRAVKALFFFPFVISQVVVGVVFAWFYDPSFGLFNIALGWFGIEPISILADEDYVTYGIIAAGLWPQISYCMILYLTGLNNLDPEQIEAARLDGAKRLKMLWYVVIPQLRPATFIAIVVTVIGALRSFDLVATMTSGGPWGSSSVLAYQMYEESIFNYRMGYGASVSVVLFLIMDIYIAYFLWRMLRSEK